MSVALNQLEKRISKIYQRYKRCMIDDHKAFVKYVVQIYKQNVAKSLLVSFLCSIWVIHFQSNKEIYGKIHIKSFPVFIS